MMNFLGNIKNNYMQENVSLPRYRIGSINSWSKEFFGVCCELLEHVVVNFHLLSHARI